MQTLVLVAMIGMRQWTLATGVPVELETEPVDPRSLFSGDYVRLGYKISQLRFDELKGDTGFKRYDRVFVALAPDGPYWKAQGVYRQRVSVPEGQVAIKGEVQSVSDMLWDQGANVTRQIGNMNVVYGIENYFVPEGEGRDLERPRAGEKITIRVAVDRFGNAGIKAVLVNGNPRYEEKLF
jgi:uncharacterized membrane-anchored protein